MQFHICVWLQGLDNVHSGGGREEAEWQRRGSKTGRSYRRLFCFRQEYFAATAVEIRWNKTQQKFFPHRRRHFPHNSPTIPSPWGRGEGGRTLANDEDHLFSFSPFRRWKKMREKEKREEKSMLRFREKAAESINQKFFLINIDPNIFRHLFLLCLGKGEKHFQICRDTSFASPTNYLLVIRIFFFFKIVFLPLSYFFPSLFPQGLKSETFTDSP